MQAGYVLPIMIPQQSYHTRKHGISVYKGLSLDKTKLLFVDKNHMIREIGNDFKSLVAFLAVNRVMQLGVETENIANGIGL